MKQSTAKFLLKDWLQAPGFISAFFSLSSKTALECFEDIANKFLEKIYSLLCKLDHFIAKEKKSTKMK
jgi:hypothetical protein